MDNKNFNQTSKRLSKYTVIESRKLFEQKILAATSLRSMGNMSLIRNFDGKAELHNEKLYKLLNIDFTNSTLFVPSLMHTSNVVLVKPKSYGRVTIEQDSPEVIELAKYVSKFNTNELLKEEYLGVDACICSIDDNSYIAILPADCAPVMLYDPINRYFALAHVGVMGLFNGIVINTINCMSNWCKTNPSDLICYIAPCITSNVYKLKSSGLWDKYLKDVVDDRAADSFDLKNSIVKQLLELGLSMGNIDISQYCTATSSDKFFSNYIVQSIEEKKLLGRHMSIIGPLS